MFSLFSDEEIQELEDCRVAILETLFKSQKPLHPRDLIQGAAKHSGLREGPLSEAMWTLVKRQLIRLTDEHDFELITEQV